MNMCKFMEDKEVRNDKTAKFNKVFSNLTITVQTGSSHHDALINALTNYTSEIEFGECKVTNEWLYGHNKSIFLNSDYGDFKITVVESKNIVGDDMITIIEGLCVKG